MNLKVGDSVSAIDEIMEGIVVSIAHDRVHVKTNDGFIIQFSEKELIKTEKEPPYDFKQTPSFSEILKEKEPLRRKRTNTPSKKERSTPAMEVDLHIGQLISSTRGMDNYDMLNLQLDTAKRQLEFAMQKGFRRVIFIHGVGEGVLKSELEYLFNRYDNLKFYDADYQKYGRGATEVYIFQNPK